MSIYQLYSISCFWFTCSYLKGKVVAVHSMQSYKGTEVRSCTYS